MSKGLWALLTFVLLAILGVIGFFPWVTFVTDQDWFSALGYSEDFNVRWGTEWMLFWWTAIPVAAFMAINFIIAAALPTTSRSGDDGELSPAVIGFVGG